MFNEIRDVMQPDDVREQFIEYLRNPGATKDGVTLATLTFSDCLDYIDVVWQNHNKLARIYQAERRAAEALEGAGQEQSLPPRHHWAHESGGVAPETDPCEHEVPGAER